MSMSRYDPFREALSLRNVMDRLFEQSFVQPFWTGGSQAMSAPLDVCETDNGYEIAVALPGVKPEDIDLTATQHSLTIKGHYSYQNMHQNWHGGQEQGQQSVQQSQPQEQHRNWLMREMGTGTFERTVTLPRPIDVDKIQTSYENGILTVPVPVSEANRPKRISVSGGQPKQVTVEANPS